jgi:hypothetical protein
MRLMLTMSLAMGIVLASPAQALSPKLTHEVRMSVMDKEQRVEYAIAQFVTDRKERRCAKRIAYKESRYNEDSLNKSSGARGTWQLLWAKPGWSLLKQTEHAHKYVLHRYGTWCKAFEFHQERNWY